VNGEIAWETQTASTDWGRPRCLSLPVSRMNIIAMYMAI
jgi:hypothetical protein